MQAAPHVEFTCLELNHLEEVAHERAISRGQDHFHSGIRLLESVDEVDRLRLFEKFRLTSTFSYCMTFMKESDCTVLYMINVARTGRRIPELREAVMSGAVYVSKAAQICRVITKENAAEWIGKATQLSKKNLEKEIAKARPEAAKKSSVRATAENRHRLSCDIDDESLANLEWVQNFLAGKTSNAGISDALKVAINEFRDRHDLVRKAERNAGNLGKTTLPKRDRFQRRAVMKWSCGISGGARSRCLGVRLVGRVVSPRFIMSSEGPMVDRMSRRT